MTVLQKQNLLFLGDIYINNDDCKIELPDDYIFNFEYVAYGDNYNPIKNKINLLGNKDLSYLKKKPLAVNLANNHILDFTEKGFEATIKLLQQNNVKYFGAGTKADNYNNPCFITKEGIKIALLGYSDIKPLLCEYKTIYDVAPIDYDKIKDDIKICKKQGAEYIIVNVHWGREERPMNTKRQQQIGHFFIDQGVDLVIGHHPHCIQPYEVYKNKHIFYSLGNFAFDDIKAPSYYNSQGISEFTMYKRHSNYGRKSLAVKFTFDETEGYCNDIISTKYINKKIILGKSLFNKDVIPAIYHNKLINEFVGIFRMMMLLIKSNFFVDKKFVNIKAFAKEFEFLKKRFTK